MDGNRRRARQLRGAMTEAEQRLWQCLRTRQIEGFRFRRQVPLHGYVVDFLCPQAKLVIEVDGGQHAQRSGYDAQRTAVLERYGYRAVRYWNHDVLRDAENAASDVHRQLTRGFVPPRREAVERSVRAARIDGPQGYRLYPAILWAESSAVKDNEPNT